MTHMTQLPGYQGYLRLHEREFVVGKEVAEDRFQDVYIKPTSSMDEHDLYKSVYAKTMDKKTLVDYHRKEGEKRRQTLQQAATNSLTQRNVNYNDPSIPSPSPYTVNNLPSGIHVNGAGLNHTATINDNNTITTNYDVNNSNNAPVYVSGLVAGVTSRPWSSTGKLPLSTSATIQNNPNPALNTWSSVYRDNYTTLSPPVIRPNIATAHALSNHPGFDPAQKKRLPHQPWERVQRYGDPGVLVKTTEEKEFVPESDKDSLHKRMVAQPHEADSLPCLYGHELPISLSQTLSSVPMANNLLYSSNHAQSTYFRDHAAQGRHNLDKSGAGATGGHLKVNDTDEKEITHLHLFPSTELIGPTEAALKAQREYAAHIPTMHHQPPPPASHTSSATASSTSSPSTLAATATASTISQMATTKELFAGSTKAEPIRIPGYAGFIPASENNKGNLTGVMPFPHPKENILDTYRHDIPHYTGHQPRAVVNDHGPRTPRGKKRMNEGLVASLILDSMKI